MLEPGTVEISDGQCFSDDAALCGSLCALDKIIASFLSLYLLIEIISVSLLLYDLISLSLSLSRRRDQYLCRSPWLVILRAWIGQHFFVKSVIEATIRDSSGLWRIKDLGFFGIRTTIEPNLTWTPILFLLRLNSHTSLSLHSILELGALPDDFIRDGLSYLTIWNGVALIVHLRQATRCLEQLWLVFAHPNRSSLLGSCHSDGVL